MELLIAIVTSVLSLFSLSISFEAIVDIQNLFLVHTACRRLSQWLKQRYSCLFASQGSTLYVSLYTGEVLIMLSQSLSMSVLTNLKGMQPYEVGYEVLEAVQSFFLDSKTSVKIGNEVRENIL